MIYLDHAAAIPVSAKSLAAMLPYFSEQFFNPSALYLPAKHVREAYESAKNDLAHVIGAKGVDLVITAGATESINLAFTAMNAISTIPRPKSLILATEHTAVLAAAKRHGYILIKVNRDGLMDLADFRAKLTDDVVLVSISLANNELGTIQPLAEISEILRETRQNRLERGIMTPLYLHSDASQALNLLDINVARLGVDLLTLNSAKCGGPKGVGALYVAHGVKLQPVVVGGGQERGLRSGTENVPGLIGFATAAAEAKSHLASSRKKYQKMAQILRQTIKGFIKNPPEIHSDTSIVAQDSENVKHNRDDSIKSDQNTRNLHLSGKNSSKIPEPIFLGNPKHRLASFVPVCFPGLDAERLIYKLEAEGILVSTGAACAANKGSKSHVLAAIGLPDEEIAGSLRISLGPTNTADQIREAATIIAKIVQGEYTRTAERSAK